jgi:hypothetical protein
VPRSRTWFLPPRAALGPFVLVGLAIAFGAVLLVPELRHVHELNDSSLHASMARWAERRIRAGHSPFDGWYSYLGLGGPQFHQYQSVPHIITGYLSIPFGDGVFRWIEYLLLVTWPIPVYAGARLFGLSPWQAGTAALLSPLLVNVTGYGYEWGSYVWYGSGMWSMLWGLWLLPLAWGLSWRAVSKGKAYALTAFVLGLTCACHFITGYLALLSLGVFVLVRPRPREIVTRFGRALLVGVGGLAIFAFVFVPTLVDSRYIPADPFSKGTFWMNSYGAGKVLSWLFRGEVFDFGRWPVVSVLLAVGFVVSVVRSRRDERFRVVLGLFTLSLLLYFGHSVVGPVVDLLPRGKDLFLHRYISGVHLAGAVLAAVGAVWLFGSAVALGRRVPTVRAHRATAFVLVGLLGAAFLLPAIIERKDYADKNSRGISGQRAADKTDGQDLAALIDIAKQRGDGRIYAGTSSNWGATYRVYSVPVYIELATHDADGIGFFLRVNSLSTALEAYFDETNIAQYDLFNIKYVLTPEGQVPAVPATFLARRGRHTLWQVATSGYFEVVDTTEAVDADRTNLYSVFRDYLSSPALAQFRHPLVNFDGKGAPTPSVSAVDPYTGPPGSVSYTNVSLDDGRFTAQVSASRPAWVMLKASYHPRWGATIDGKPVKVSMLAPSFVGVPVSAGSHLVVFKYHPVSYYPALFAFGLLVLIGLTIAPRAWKGSHRPRGTATRRRDRPDRSVNRERRLRRRSTVFEEQ